ncbi:MAG TPA: uracil-DNA glycosylase [Gemmatimonadaceae bacterium]
MDARDQLRRYLEQRRELGESELVLDGLSVEEAMRVLGASASAGGAADWRAALNSAGATPAKPRPRVAPKSPSPRVEQPELTRADDPPPPMVRESPPVTTAPGSPPSGIVVGTASRELFGGEQPRFGSLAEIAAAVATCTSCSLYNGAKNSVPGEGNPNAEFMCVGEAPGAKEDETGQPFVGLAGQLLTKILAAIQLTREDVFIGNVLKHRPPGNRNPLPDEVKACSPYLIRQIELIRPKVILALGTFAAQTLLETKLTIGKLRGQIHRYYGVPLIVTYHPAALLRNPSWKRPTWEDVQLARRILDDARARG